MFNQTKNLFSLDNKNINFLLKGFIATVLIVGSFFVASSAKALIKDPASVSSQSELQKELDNNVGTIIISNDFDVTSTVLISHPVTIKGNGKTISFAGNDRDVWSTTHNPYIFQVYNTDNVVIENITLTHGNAGLFVNDSKVRLEGEIDVSGNGYGGIESTNTKAVLDLSDATLKNSTEAFGLPTVWEDGTTGTTVNNFVGTTSLTAKSGQFQYYLVASNATKTVPVAPVIINSGGSFGGGFGGGSGYSGAVAVIAPTITSTPVTTTPEVTTTSTTTSATSIDTAPTVTVSPVGEVLGEQSYNFTLTLRKGSKGEEVKNLQEFLNTELGLDLSLDGIFGPKTEAAVVKFQLAHSLKGDGIVGPLTRAVLNK